MSSSKIVCCCNWLGIHDGEDATTITGAFSGYMINADNVTLKSCKVTAGSCAVINITSGSTGVVLQDCEMNGLSAEGARGTGGQRTFPRNNIHHSEDGIYLTGSNTRIQDNFIHDLQLNCSGPHHNGSRPMTVFPTSASAMTRLSIRMSDIGFDTQ